MVSCNLQLPPGPLLHKEEEPLLRPILKVAPALQSGYTLAGVLVLIAIMSIFMAMSVPIWDRVKQRENEEELAFRGTEYVEAIGRYHQKLNSYPPDIKTLYEMKFLRRLYKDPMTESGEWKVLHPDSLVETGAAGAISQPGSKNPDDQGDENQDSKSPQNQHSGTDDSKDQESKDKNQVGSDRNNDEEAPEDKNEVSIGPVVGVASRSKKSSLRIYNGQSTYNKWIFAYQPQQQQGQQPGPKPGGDKGKKDQKPIVKPPPKPGANNQGLNQNDIDNN